MTSVNVTTTTNTVDVTTDGSTTVVQVPSTSVAIATSAGPQGPTGAAGPPKSITIAPPKPGDEFTLFYTQSPTTLTQVLAVVRGVSPAVTFELRYGPDRSAAGTLAIVPETVTNKTFGETIALQNLPIPADNFLWLVITTVTGTVQEISITVEL